MITFHAEIAFDVCERYRQLDFSVGMLSERNNANHGCVADPAIFQDYLNIFQHLRFEFEAQTQNGHLLNLSELKTP